MAKDDNPLANALKDVFKDALKDIYKSAGKEFVWMLDSSRAEFENMAYGRRTTPENVQFEGQDALANTQTAAPNQEAASTDANVAVPAQSNTRAPEIAAPNNGPQIAPPADWNSSHSAVNVETHRSMLGFTKSTSWSQVWGESSGKTHGLGDTDYTPDTSKEAPWADIPEREVSQENDKQKGMEM